MLLQIEFHKFCGTGASRIKTNSREISSDSDSKINADRVMNPRKKIDNFEFIYK
jgi:hypothetical protein